MLLLHSSNAKRNLSSSTYLYLHCNLIDQDCLTTMTMTISGNVIDHHEKKIQLEIYVKFENFAVRCKHSGGFQKGDMPYALLVSVNTTITILPLFILKLLPIFYTKIYIRDFNKRCHKSFPMATFGAIVVGIKGLYKNAGNEDYFQVVIANGLIKEDHDIVGFSKAFHDQYSKIKRAFEARESVLVMFKTLLGIDHT